jgi:hypothetical protein
MAALLPTIPAHIFLILSVFLKTSLAFVPDFSNYPPASISCLTNAAVTSSCNADSSTLLENNACLCSNGGGFFTLAAQCIQVNAPGALQNVYTTAVTNCDSSNTPVTISLAQFLAAAQGGISSSTTSASTFLTSILSPSTTQQAAPTTSLQQPNPSTTSTQSPSTTASGSSGNSNGGGGGGGGLNKSDVIALAVGIPATVFTILGVLIMCCK